jgi:23S rRNA (cytosine1962-C5)-methyltransferase
LRFGIHLRHPRNVGLFLDTRPLREILTGSCRGTAVLNLFSYSCSLGVAAAAGGAATVVNVDISARYLGWGRENFALSGMPLEHARFTRMDSEEYLDWAARKSMLFDVVILDPPSFSRGGGKIYSFEKDYFRLLAKSAGRLRPGGRVYAVTNYGGITPARFREGVENALQGAGHEGCHLNPFGLPEDFDPGPDGKARQAAREGAFLAMEARLR